MHVNSVQNSQLSAVCRKPWDHKTRFSALPLVFLSFQSLGFLSSFCYLIQKHMFIKAKGFRITRLPEVVTLRPWGNIPCRHCYSAAAFIPAPLTESHMVFTSVFSETTKTSQIFPITHNRAWCLTAKSTSQFFLTKNNLSNSVSYLQITQTSICVCSEVIHPTTRTHKACSRGPALLDTYIPLFHCGNFCQYRAAVYFACIMLSCL